MRLPSLLLLTVATAWYLRTVYRLRDPVRIVEAQPDVVLSPADGLVSFVRRVERGQVRADGGGVALALGDLLDAPAGDGWLLGIFVGPLDAHYLYQPVGGQVTAVSTRGSRADRPLLGVAGLLGVLAGQPPELLHTRATLENARLSVTTRSALGDITVALVEPGSGLGAEAYLRPGDAGRAGHKLSFAPEGGLLLLHLPDTLPPRVGVGDRVLGAQTVVARA